MSKKIQSNHFTGKYFVILLAATLIIAIFVALRLVNSYSFDSQPITTDINEIKSQSSDTDVDSIETDLESTDFEELDKELQDIENEFNVSL